jgi:hypothetical protein
MASLPFAQMSNEHLLAYGKKKGPYLSDEKLEALKSEFQARGLDESVIYAKEDREAFALQQTETSSLPMSREDVIASKLAQIKRQENYGWALLMLGSLFFLLALSERKNFTLAGIGLAEGPISKH